MFRLFTAFYTIGTQVSPPQRLFTGLGLEPGPRRRRGIEAGARGRAEAEAAISSKTVVKNDSREPGDLRWLHTAPSPPSPPPTPRSSCRRPGWGAAAQRARYCLPSRPVNQARFPVHRFTGSPVHYESALNQPRGPVHRFTGSPVHP